MAETVTTAKKGGWFSKIPTNVILSPAGLVLLLYAAVMEFIDLIPIPFVDQLWELPLELGFILLLTILAKTPLKASVIPFILERIPFLSDILPTWIIRLLA